MVQLRKQEPLFLQFNGDENWARIHQTALWFTCSHADYAQASFKDIRCQMQWFELIIEHTQACAHALPRTLPRTTLLFLEFRGRRWSIKATPRGGKESKAQTPSTGRQTHTFRHRSSLDNHPLKSSLPGIWTLSSSSVSCASVSLDFFFFFFLLNLWNGKGRCEDREIKWAAARKDLLGNERISGKKFASEQIKFLQVSNWCCKHY